MAIPRYPNTILHIQETKTKESSKQSGKKKQGYNYKALVLVNSNLIIFCPFLCMKTT